MFNTAVIVLALIGTSLVQAHPAANNPDLRPLAPLDCHRGVAPKIDFIDSKFSLIDRVYSICADNIRIINCEFHSSPDQLLQIVGPNVTLYGNKFNGKLLNFTVFGENVMLVNNSFNGINQLHEIVGDQVILTGNSYNGMQTHNIKAEILNKISNKYLGNEQTHQLKARVIYEVDNKHLGEQYYTLDANMITQVNNTYSGSPQIHNIKANIFYRTRNDYYGCHQQHNSNVMLLLDYFNHFKGYRIAMKQLNNTETSVGTQISYVLPQKCANLTPLGPSSKTY